MKMLHKINENDTYFYSKEGQHLAPGLPQCIYCWLLDYLDFHNLDHQPTRSKQRFQITQNKTILLIELMTFSYLLVAM